MSTTEPTTTPSHPENWAPPARLRFGYAANTLMLKIATRFLWLGYFLVWLAAIYFFLAAPRSRRASMRYLDRIHGKNRPPRRALASLWLTYRHMVTFGFLLLDRALMLARPAHGFHITSEGHQALRDAALAATEKQTGIILLTAHFGMAEIAAPCFSRLGDHRRVNIVMYQDPADSTEKFHSRHRHMLHNIAIISTRDPLAAGIKIIAALKRGEVVAMRADRTLAGKGIPITLLGDPVLLPAGPFVTAALSAAPVLYVYTCRTGYRRYHCTMTAAPPSAPASPDTPRNSQIAAAAQSFATHLESTLRHHPFQWSNFYDLWQTQCPTA